MAFKDGALVSQRRDFVKLAQADNVNVSELCRRFGISRPTGYKWMERFDADGEDGLHERSRRPRHSPRQVADAVEQAVLAVRQQHPAWGGRKIRKRLQILKQLPPEQIPAASTVTEILRRHACLNRAVSAQRRRWQRFERAAANELWQMDFKGHFELTGGGRCYPLTILDDHSRFALAVRACGNEQGATVQAELIAVFRRYGMPDSMLMDNGAPWGGSDRFTYMPLSIWLLRLGIHVIHSRPRHPQTLGKDERFHRTLKAEVISGRPFRNLAACQRRFDPWRHAYNYERPHEALNLDVPGQRYQISARVYPEQLPAIEYGPDDIVRKVYPSGQFRWRGLQLFIGKGFRDHPIALRPTASDGFLAVYFCQHKIAEINLHNQTIERYYV